MKESKGKHGDCRAGNAKCNDNSRNVSAGLRLGSTEALASHKTSTIKRKKKAREVRPRRRSPRNDLLFSEKMSFQWSCIFIVSPVLLSLRPCPPSALTTVMICYCYLLPRFFWLESPKHLCPRSVPHWSNPEELVSYELNPAAFHFKRRRSSKADLSIGGKKESS